MNEKIHIHVSDMRNFKSCRIKWNFASPLRGGWAPRTTPKALKLGTLVHQALEAWYESRKTIKLSKCWQTVWEAELIRLDVENVPYEVPDMEELRDKAFGILQTYANWCQLNDKYEVVHVEQAFEVPLITNSSLTSEVWLAGKFDLVVRDPLTGVLWVRDFKVTTAEVYDYSAYLRDQDDQARAYVFAAKQLFPDEKVGGVIFTMLRAKKPTVPELLKTGKGISRRACDTTLEVYMRALQKYNLDPAEYEEEIEAIKTKSASRPWVYETRLSFDTTDLFQWSKRARSTVRTMVAENTPLWPSDFFTCKGCAFRGPCAGFLREGQEYADAILKAQYVPGKWAVDALELLEESGETE